MLPDLSPTHILIVIVVALIVVGPKDLPMLLRKLGQFMGRMRGMANEFRASFDEMARQSELDELRKEVEAMRKASLDALPTDLGLDTAALNHSNAESAYASEWQASSPSDENYMSGAPVMTSTAGEAEPAAAAKAGKPKAAASRSKAAGATAPKAKTAAKAPAKAAKAGDAPKPRAKKVKTAEGEA